MAEVDGSDGRLTGPWWERLITVSLYIVVGAFLLVTFAAVMVPDVFPGWFGVQAVAITNQDVRYYVPPKTLWDWFGLIAIPLSIVVVGYVLNRADRSHERRLQDQQVQETRKIEAQRIVESRNVEERRIQEARELEAQRIAENHKIEEERLKEVRELEENRAQDAIVNNYLDQMTELLLTRGLRTSLEGDEVRSVARARTLTTLRGVDGGRKATVVQFLYEAQLIGYMGDEEAVGTVMQLHGADLNRASLVETDLNGADLNGVILSRANLNRATLKGSNLNGAKLFGTKFNGAKLQGAWLLGADLRGADLQGADLRGATLRGAYLISAKLFGANLNGAKLQGAWLLGADLRGADLQGADLRGATLRGGYLNNASLQGANLNGVTLVVCLGLTLAQLRQARSLRGAILPDYIDPTDLGNKWSPPKPEDTPELRP